MGRTYEGSCPCCADECSEPCNACEACLEHNAECEETHDACVEACAEDPGCIEACGTTRDACLQDCGEDCEACCDCDPCNLSRADLFGCDSFISITCNLLEPSCDEVPDTHMLPCPYCYDESEEIRIATYSVECEDIENFGGEYTGPCDNAPSAGCCYVRIETYTIVSIEGCE